MVLVLPLLLTGIIRSFCRSYRLACILLSSRGCILNWLMLMQVEPFQVTLQQNDMALRKQTAALLGGTPGSLVVQASVPPTGRF